MSDIKETLFKLSQKVSLGDVCEASDFAKNELKKYADVKELNGLGFYGLIDNKKEKTVMIEAHIDEVGFVVTNVDDNGFLTVSPCGGIDAKILPSAAVVVHTEKEKLKAVFSSTPPHLAKDTEGVSEVADLKLDSGLSFKAKDKISVGDFVSYSSVPKNLCGNTVAGKSFDNRAGCTVLIELAKRLRGKDIPVNVALLFSDQEELGCRGARTATYQINPDEAVAVDVSFASAPDVPADKCGKLGSGAMIGISPVLSKNIYKKLIDLAKDNNIKYQTEVMGGRTGTDADVISLTKEGIPCGLVSIPLRNMHSPVEVISTDDVIATVDLIEKYIVFGGAF